MPRSAACAPSQTAHSTLATAAADHGPELTRWLRGRVRDPDAAEDLRQEVFLRVARQPPGIADWRAYLFRVARSVLADRGRARRTAPQVQGLDAAADRACEAPGAVQQMIDAERLAKLRRAVADLPGVQRQALIWARIEGLPLRIIGERLGVSESMACRYLNQALKTCQDRLDGSE
ncbi:hypothetical protein BZG35_08625 [Brevundimonas sp. LM2]|nr:hypothetical protein BZG35_08625 [Brevundimonas sp. LM2]